MRNHVVLGALGLTLLLAPRAHAGEIAFRFNPPDGTAYLSSDRTTTEVEVKVGTMKPMAFKTVVEARTRVAIQNTGMGYTVSRRPLSFAQTLNGVPLEEPGAKAMHDVPWNFVLDEEGTLLEVSGYPELKRRLAESQNPQAIALLASSLSEETIQKAFKRDWKESVARFSGQTASPSDTWVESEETELPLGGSMRMIRKTQFSPVPKSPKRVRIRVSLLADKAALSSQMNQELLARLRAMGGKSGGSVTITELTMTKEQVVDPETMLMDAAFTEFTMRAMMPQSDVKSAFTIRIRQEEARSYER